MRQKTRKTKAYTRFKNCRACGSVAVSRVVDLGEMPLARGFIPASVRNLNKEKTYPLRLLFCTKCYLLQADVSIRPDTLFKYYYYRSSVIKTLVRHFDGIAALLARKLGKTKERFVVEIGCNDGSFVKAALKRGFRALGVDPATNLVSPLIKKGMPIVNDYFTTAVAQSIAKKHGKADVIFSSNTLAHIEDINDVFSGIALLLKDDGMLIFEVHYLGSLLEETQYDMIYHEHQYYYSALSAGTLLARHDLELFDVERVPIHAGSVRFYAQKRGVGARQKSARLKRLVAAEKRKRYNSLDAYRMLGRRIADSKKELVQLLTGLKKKGKVLAGYGASGRATIISNYCKLGGLIDRVIDDSPLKQGTRMPGTHSRVVSSDILYEQRRAREMQKHTFAFPSRGARKPLVYGSGAPDYVVLFAWAFLDEIRKKHKKFLARGGRFIVPLPRVKTIAR